MVINAAQRRSAGRIYRYLPPRYRYNTENLGWCLWLIPISPIERTWGEENNDVVDIGYFERAIGSRCDFELRSARAAPINEHGRDYQGRFNRTNLSPVRI